MIDRDDSPREEGDETDRLRMNQPTVEEVLRTVLKRESGPSERETGVSDGGTLHERVPHSSE